MQARHLNFTKKGIEQLPIPEKKTLYHDTKVRSLKLKIRPSGSKSFMFYRKINGYPEYIMLGRFPEVTVENARNEVTKYNTLIAQGINPAEKQRAIRSEMTFGQLFEQYIERHAKLHKKSWEKDRQRYNCYLMIWENQKLSAIKKTDIQSLHTKIGTQNGRYAANRTLALIHAMFSKAHQWGWEYPNPAHGIQKFKEYSRERFLHADELPRFFEALSQDLSRALSDYILLSLFTGARKTNILSMRWEDVHLERKTWVIPMTKNDDPHTLPLVPPAIEILQRRKKENIENSPWVFPSDSKTGYFMDPKRGWKRILKRANIQNLRMHDLRRSLGSWQAATGASLSVIGKTLAHRNVSTTAIYARLDLNPVRDAMQKATEAMLTAGMVQSSDTEENSKQ
jgi:integrase